VEVVCITTDMADVLINDRKTSRGKRPLATMSFSQKGLRVSQQSVLSIILVGRG
jgi:hypothetical protein